MKNNKTGIQRVAKLYGRCLMIQAGDATFEVKVMGDRALAATEREALLAAFQASGISVVDLSVVGATIGKERD